MFIITITHSISVEKNIIFHKKTHQDGLVVSVSSHEVGRGFAPKLGHTKHHHKMEQTASSLGKKALG